MWRPVGGTATKAIRASAAGMTSVRPPPLDHDVAGDHVDAAVGIDGGEGDVAGRRRRDAEGEAFADAVGGARTLSKRSMTAGASDARRRRRRRAARR
jgi:hypothetical protein